MPAKKPFSLPGVEKEIYVRNIRNAAGNLGVCISARIPCHISASNEKEVTIFRVETNPFE
jgi:hypothetical protein